MTRTTISFVCTVCALTALIAAQDGMGSPTPAVELAKFEPLVGNWSGKGVGHSIFGAASLMESFKATYTKKQ